MTLTIFIIALFTALAIADLANAISKKVVYDSFKHLDPLGIACFVFDVAVISFGIGFLSTVKV